MVLLPFLLSMIASGLLLSPEDLEMVCYDRFYPEVARELSNRGAEVIAFPVWGCNPLLASARACENHVFVVSSTYTDIASNWMITIRGVYP